MPKKLRVNSFVSRISYPGIQLSAFPIKTISLDDLLTPCRTIRGFTEEVLKSVKKEGLIDPVIVVRVSTEDWFSYAKSNNFAKHKDRVGDRQTLNVVWGGNNRVEMARILGYDAIDCVMLPNFQLASEVQSIQRKRYTKKKNAPRKKERSR